MQNNRKQVVQKSQDFVFDNKVSGNLESLTNRQAQLEARLKACDKNLENSSLEVQKAFLKIVENDSISERAKRFGNNQGRGENVKKSIELALKSELGIKKAQKVSEQFIKDTQERNVKKASENLVKNIEDANKKFSGLTIGTFDSKTKPTNAPKYGKDAIIRQMMINNPKTVNPINRVEPQTQDSSNCSKLVSKHLNLMNMRDATIRQIRRNARDLKIKINRMIEINNADNGIAFNQVGLENARFAREHINNVMNIVNASEASIHRNSNRGNDLNIDALLQRGRASMMQVNRRSIGLQRHLIRQKEREQERVRC